jgi:hypothetical protein
MTLVKNKKIALLKEEDKDHGIPLLVHILRRSMKRKK